MDEKRAQRDACRIVVHHCASINSRTRALSRSLFSVSVTESHFLPEILLAAANFLLSRTFGLLFGPVLFGPVEKSKHREPGAQKMR
jgi:hypothetical protein